MKKIKTWFGYLGLILIGLIIGYFIGVSKTSSSENNSETITQQKELTDTGFVGKSFINKELNYYIKFINSNTIESVWMRNSSPEEFKYTVEGNQIRTVSGFGVVRYIDIISENELTFVNETYYKQ